MPPRLACVLLAALLAAGCAPAERGADAPSVAPRSPARQFVDEVRKTVLPNGLTVLVREQRGSGIVAINTWVKAGYFHEPDEVAGMAHLFEHMFFKGSRKYPGPEAIDNAIAGVGGTSNAGTIYNYTSYHAVLPSESFAKGIEIQADAVANPIFDPAELRKEAEVVIEESNRKLDNPGPVALERMLATAFTQHRIRRWRIGSNEVLRNIRRDDLVAFFETLYRPDNMILSITGDVAADEALAVARRTFGEIPRGTTRKQRGPQEPPQAAFRFGRSEADIRESYTVFGWHTVPEGHRDETTIDVLAGMLGKGRSSRLYLGAVGPGAASTASAFQMNYEDVGILVAMATHAEANRAAVEERVAREVERMKRFGPTAYELAAAKNAAQAQFLSGIETALGQAEALSRYEARGSYREIADELARIDAVSAEDVREAARRYLVTTNLTLYHYAPRGSEATPPLAALERIRRAEASPLPQPASQPLPDMRHALRPASADAPPRAFTLSNGATLVVQQRSGTPIVSTGVFFRGGRSQEQPANAGITRLALATMRGGTATRSGEQVDRELEFLGTQIQTTTWEDGFGLTVTGVDRFLEPALAVLADVLLAPTFPAPAIAREKALQASALRRSQDSGIERPLQVFREAAFPGHPYGLNERGTEATIAAIDRAALQAWWRESIAADRALVVVVGNADAEDVRRIVEEKLGRMPRGPVALKPVPAPPAPPQPTEAIESRDRKQTAMVLGFPAVPPSHPDWYALRLMQSVTSMGLSGTFYRELRARRSLAYVVFARAQAYAHAGMFIGYLAGEAPKEAAARAALRDEFRKLRGEGIVAEDVARAKAYFAGTTRIGREESGDRVLELGRNYALGAPLDFVDRTLAAVPRITDEELRAVAARYFAGENYVYAAVRGTAK
jgi:zinc protease